MTTKENILNALRSRKHEFSMLGIREVGLFGSYIRGDQRKDSDIDVLIVTENENDNLTGKIWSLTKRVNSRIEPYLIDKDRFINNKDSLLIDLVKRTGIEIT